MQLDGMFWALVAFGPIALPPDWSSIMNKLTVYYFAAIISMQLWNEMKLPWSSLVLPVPYLPENWRCTARKFHPSSWRWLHIIRMSSSKLCHCQWYMSMHIPPPTLLHSAVAAATVVCWKVKVSPRWHELHEYVYIMGVGWGGGGCIYVPSTIDTVLMWLIPLPATNSLGPGSRFPLYSRGQAFAKARQSLGMLYIILYRQSSMAYIAVRAHNCLANAYAVEDL